MTECTELIIGWLLASIMSSLILKELKRTEDGIFDKILIFVVSIILYMSIVAVLINTYSLVTTF
jgi:hypothetical protein